MSRKDVLPFTIGEVADVVNRLMSDAKNEKAIPPTQEEQSSVLHQGSVNITLKLYRSRD